MLVAELNMGQLRAVIRSTFLVDAVGLNKVQGQPFKVREVVAAIEQLLAPVADANADITHVAAPHAQA